LSWFPLCSLDLPCSSPVCFHRSVLPRSSSCACLIFLVSALFCVSCCRFLGRPDFPVSCLVPASVRSSSTLVLLLDFLASGLCLCTDPLAYQVPADSPGALGFRLSLLGSACQVTGVCFGRAAGERFSFLQICSQKVSPKILWFCV
jgi:hypothetical protein